MSVNLASRVSDYDSLMRHFEPSVRDTPFERELKTAVRKFKTGSSRHKEAISLAKTTHTGYISNGLLCGVMGGYERIFLEIPEPMSRSVSMSHSAFSSALAAACRIYEGTPLDEALAINAMASTIEWKDTRSEYKHGQIYDRIDMLVQFAASIKTPLIVRISELETAVAESKRTQTLLLERLLALETTAAVTA